MARIDHVRIRRVRAADRHALAALLAEAFAEEFEHAGADWRAARRQARWAVGTQLAGVRHALALARAQIAFFAAEVEGRVVGCAAVGGSRVPVISSVAVDPEYRRAGVARALVEAAHMFAREHGRDRIVLDVLLHNTAALTLYGQLGYEEYHRFHAYELAHLGAVIPLAAPPGYWLERPTPGRLAPFTPVERASLPPRVAAMTPTLRERYLQPRLARWLERLTGGSRAYRRALVRHDRTVGYLSATAPPGQREGRIEYPLVLPEAIDALPAALIDAVHFLQGAGRSLARLDLSAERPDQHAVAEQLGFRRRWTFVQMVHRLATPIRLPVRVRDAS